MASGVGKEGGGGGRTKEKHSGGDEGAMTAQRNRWPRSRKQANGNREIRNKRKVNNEPNLFLQTQRKRSAR